MKKKREEGEEKKRKRKKDKREKERSGSLWRAACAHGAVVIFRNLPT